MKRILFVDDEPHILSGLERMLHGQRHEWSLAFAGCGRDALALIAGEPFDVVVSDLRMPGMDGLGLLTEVQGIRPDAIRIVLSGQTELEAALRTVRIAHQFLTKPCDSRTVRDVIERACRLHILLEDESLRRVVNGLVSLPVKPQAYAQLTAAFSRAEVSLKELAAIVESDIGLCTRILQLVNSSYFGLSRPLHSMERAVTYLGANTIANLTLTAEVFHRFDESQACPGFSLDAEQEHACNVAKLARRMVSDPREQADAFMAAMLHDVGTLVLAMRPPVNESPVLTSFEGEAQFEVKPNRAGVTHAEVGAYLLGLWGLPYSIVEAVANHHNPARAGAERFDALGAVHVADGLVREALGERQEVGVSIDLDYLESVGSVDRVDEWRRMVAAELATA